VTPPSQAVRSCGVIVTPIAAWTATLAYDAVYPGMPAYVHVLYAIGLSAAAWGFWDRQQRPHELGAAMATSFAVALTPAKHLYWFLQSTLLAKALPYLLAGLILLGLAILVSFYKGGLLWRGWSALRRLNEQLRRQAIP